MDYSLLKRELLIHLRGQLPQSQVNSKLGVNFNKIYRWESSSAHMMWPDFIKLCQVLKIPLHQILKECFSFTQDPKKSQNIVKLFMGNSTQAEMAKILNISRYTLSRWLNGVSDPTVEQVFALMDYAAPEFLKFIELITEGKILSSMKVRVQQHRAQAKHFSKYPWLSTLLSALTLEEYKKHPTDVWLAKKIKMPLSDIQSIIKDLSESGILEWNGQYWVCHFNRMYVQAKPDEVIDMARYVFKTALESVDVARGNPNMRLSWKIFSLNQKKYDKILQRYSEFFNDIGKIIDEESDGLDKVYIMATAIVDYDQLKEK